MKNKQPLTPKQKVLMYTILDYIFLFLFCVSGFIVYEVFFGHKNQGEAIISFEIIQKNTYKLNWALAMPLLIGIIAFLGVVFKKNKDFFKGKSSILAIIAMFVFYLIYSLMGMVVSVLVGVVMGTALDDFIFTPLIEKYKAQAETEIETETP